MAHQALRDALSQLQDPETPPPASLVAMAGLPQDASPADVWSTLTALLAGPVCTISHSAATATLECLIRMIVRALAAAKDQHAAKAAVLTRLKQLGTASRMVEVMAHWPEVRSLQASCLHATVWLLTKVKQQGTPQGDELAATAASSTPDEPAFADERVVGLVVRALRCFPNDLLIASLCLTVLATMASAAPLRPLLVPDATNAILTCMSAFGDDERVLEDGLRFLANLILPNDAPEDDDDVIARCVLAPRNAV